MSIKKKSKQKSSRSVAVKEKLKSFFEINKDVIPKQESQKSVRVKTFIVEKPIIIHDKPQHINLSRDDFEEDSVFDAKKSKYSKKKRFRGEEAPVVEDDESIGNDGVESGEDFDSSEDSLGEEGSAESTDFSEEGLTDEEANAGNVEQQVIRKHARSRAMVNNVWWKKALFWGILVWLAILLFSVGMASLGLVELDLRRQWWFFLAGILVISLIYFGIVESRLKF